MKTQTSKVMKKKTGWLVMLLAFMTLTVQQTSAQVYDSLEQVEDSIENINLNVYNILKDYPLASYEILREDGKIKDIVITGVTDPKDVEQLKVYLVNKDKLRNAILNRPNRIGIYYAVETQPAPKMGYKDLYANLYDEIQYPEDAREQGIEGSVFVKFVVDSNGEISNVITADNIDSDADWIVNKLDKEAKEAVLATSGEWIPAKIGGVPVSQWMVLPIQFKLEGSPYFPDPLY